MLPQSKFAFFLRFANCVSEHRLALHGGGSTSSAMRPGTNWTVQNLVKCKRVEKRLAWTC